MSGMGISLGGLEIATDFFANPDLYEPDLTEIKSNISKKSMSDITRVTKPIKPKITKESILNKFSILQTAKKPIKDEIIDNMGFIKDASDFDFNFDNLDADTEVKTESNKLEDNTQVDIELDNSIEEDTQDEFEIDESELFGDEEDTFEDENELDEDDIENDTEDEEDNIENIVDSNENELDAPDFEIDESELFGDEDSEDEEDDLEDENELDEDDLEDENELDEDDLEVEEDAAVENKNNTSKESEPNFEIDESELFGDDDFEEDEETEEEDELDFESEDEPEEEDELDFESELFGDEDSEIDIADDEQSIKEYSKTSEEKAPISTIDANNKVSKPQVSEIKPVIKDVAIKNTENIENQELVEMRKKLAEMEKKLQAVENNGTQNTTSKIKENNKKLDIESRIEEARGSAFKREEPAGSIYDKYTVMPVDNLYKEVKIYMEKLGVTKRAIDISTLNTKFGDTNIRKLIQKSYLIKVGKGVTAGR